MVLRFASQKLLNLYFKCLILHLIKYIQRNKEYKEKHSGCLSVSMTETEKMGFVCECVLCQLCDCDKCFHLRYT